MTPPRQIKDFSPLLLTSLIFILFLRPSWVLLIVGSPGLNQGGSRRSGSTRAFDMNQLQKSVEVMEKQSSSHTSNRSVVQRSSSSATAHNEIEVVTSTNGGGGGHAKATPLASALAASTENGQEKKAKVRGMWGRISKQGMMAQAAAAAAQQGQPQPSDQQQTQPRSSLKAGGGGGWDQVLNPMIQKQKQRKRSQAEELNSYYSQQAYSQQQQGIFFWCQKLIFLTCEDKVSKVGCKKFMRYFNRLNYVGCGAFICHFKVIDGQYWSIWAGQVAISTVTFPTFKGHFIMHKSTRQYITSCLKKFYEIVEVVQNYKTF